MTFKAGMIYKHRIDGQLVRIEKVTAKMVRVGPSHRPVGCGKWKYNFKNFMELYEAVNK